MLFTILGQYMNHNKTKQVCRYQPASVLLNYLECLGSQYKGRATVLNIGTSGEGRQVTFVLYLFYNKSCAWKDRSVYFHINLYNLLKDISLGIDFLPVSFDKDVFCFAFFLII